MIPHDPGDPGPRPVGPGDPAVSQVVYALRDLGVAGRAPAVDVLAAVSGAGLTRVQVVSVLAAFPTPTAPDDPVHDEGDDDPPGVSWSPDGVDRWYVDHSND